MSQLKLLAPALVLHCEVSPNCRRVQHRKLHWEKLCRSQIVAGNILLDGPARQTAGLAGQSAGRPADRPASFPPCNTLISNLTKPLGGSDHVAIIMGRRRDSRWDSIFELEEVDFSETTIVTLGLHLFLLKDFHI